MPTPEPTSGPVCPWRLPQLWGARVRLWTLLVGLGIVLFPFDWLSEVWSPFGRLFDQVFVSEVQHAIGHATMFLLMSLLILLSVPALRLRPAWYFGLMLLVGVAQETLQDVFRQVPPNIYEGRDLFFDVAGAAASCLLVLAWHRLFPGKQRAA
ncbi:MAG TPA: hypothetical protein VFU69_01300 [Ktedonobacterales bacterium]|nr:hypothetical protein [Ktedonobacterales bacterium]